MVRKADPRRSIAQLVWISLGISDQLWNALDGKIRVDLNHMGHLRQSSDWHDVVQQGVLVIKRRVDGVHWTGKVQRVSVRRSTDNRIQRDIAAATGAVLDYERLSHPF